MCCHTFVISLSSNDHLMSQQFCHIFDSIPRSINTLCVNTIPLIRTTMNYCMHYYFTLIFTWKHRQNGVQIIEIQRCKDELHMCCLLKYWFRSVNYCFDLQLSQYYSIVIINYYQNMIMNIFLKTMLTWLYNHITWLPVSYS